MDNGRITSNRFEIYQPFEEDGGCGLYLDNCTGYWVEENTFKHVSDTTTKGIGIVVNNSGTDPNEIYRNTFISLEQGISAQEQNRSSRDGLQILCNDFDECLADVFVPESIYEGKGIAPNQGSNDTVADAMAGNLFYIEGIIPDDDYDDLNNEGTHFYYYYPQNYGIGYLRVVPVDYTTSTITDVDKFITSGSWEFDDGCPSQITSGGGEYKSTGTSFKGQLIYYSEQVNILENTLNDLIDGGNTMVLNTEVELSTPPEALDVFNDLMNKSPFVSEIVVSTSVEKEDVLPNAMVRDIMVNNPQSAKADDLVDKLDDRATPIPDYMKAQILAGRSIVSPKEKLESQVAAYKLKKMKTINALVRDYFSTESSWDIAADSVMVLFQQDNELQSKYRLAMLHFEKGEYETGEDVIDDISSQFDLTNEELAAHQNWIAFYDLMVGLENSNITLDNLTAGQIETITTIYENTEGVASAWARDMLQAMGEITYEEPILMENLLKSSDEIEAYNAILETEPPSQVSVYPNPTNGYLIVEYDLEGKQTGTIEISDMTGKLMDKRVVNQTKDQLTFVVKEWKTGTYIVSMKNDGKLIESCKFTIVK